MVCQVQWNCQTWPLIISCFLVPEPIKMTYRPQRMQSGQDTVKRWEQGSRSCHRNRWHVSTHPSASLGCIPVFAAEDKGIKRGEVKWLGMKLGNRQSLTVEALWPDFLQSLPAACLLLLLYSLHPHQVYNLFYFLLSKTLLDQLSYTSQYFRTRWRVRVINKGQHFRSLIYRYGI